MTHDMNRHDNASTFILLLVCMSRSSVVGWWMSSLGVQLHLLMIKCMESSMVVGSLDVAFAHFPLLVCLKSWQVHSFGKSACLSIHPSMSTSCMFSHLSIHEHIFAWSSACDNISSHELFVRLLVNLSFCMCSISSSRLSSCHVCLYTCTYSHSWWDDIKYKNLLVYHDTWSFRMQVARRCNKVVRQDGGSEHCLWKLCKRH